MGRRAARRGLPAKRRSHYKYRIAAMASIAGRADSRPSIIASATPRPPMPRIAMYVEALKLLEVNRRRSRGST